MKPIALIADSFQQGLQWAESNLPNITYYSPHHNVIMANGLKYVIITHLEHIWGYEFSDYKDIAAYRNPASHYINLIIAIKERIR